MNRIKLLVLEGHGSLTEQIRGYNLPEEVVLHHTADPVTAVQILRETNIDIILLDLTHINGSATNFIRSLKSGFPDLEMLVVDPESSGEKSLKPFKYGLSDSLCGTLHFPELKAALEQTRSFLKFRNHSNQLDLNFQHFINESRLKSGPQIIGASTSIKTIASLILLVSQAEDTSVMITGESGTGKELVARGIHALSNRQSHAFHAVNCSAIPDSLFESEFFGHIKGAFTGAIEKSIGWFEMANKGTLFLDEITELPLCMQSKFLRVLDDKTIHKIGSHQEVNLNLRIISATNQDLHKLIEKKMFREDLYHRLHAFHIHIPPLRERKVDIPVLLNHYVSVISARMNKAAKPIDDRAMERLMAYSFPGNVRELRNLVEGAVIMSDENKLTLKNFRFDGQRTADRNGSIQAQLSLNLFDVEKKTIIQALTQTKNNKSEAARLLSISRQALDRRIMKLQIVF